MSKKWKMTLALAAITVTMVAGTLNVSAEGVKDVFDAKYYADTNADLKAAFGNDWDAYVNHYFEFGKAEGRTAGTPGYVGTAGTMEKQETAPVQISDSYIQHGSKFYSAEWKPMTTNTIDWINGNESYIVSNGREVTVTDADYWHAGSGTAPEGYEMKTVKVSVRKHPGSRRKGALNAFELGDFNYYDWGVGWESSSALQTSIKNTTSSGENTTTSNDTFTVVVNGVQYTNCSYHLDMEYTSLGRRAYLNSTITVCLPKGYNDFTIAVSYADKNVVYVPMP